MILRTKIRWMVRADMPEVLAIERVSFEFPWFEEDFIRCLRQRTCIGMVAEHDDRIVGYMIYELHKTRIHLLNLAVHPAARRRTVGQQMMERLFGKLSRERRCRLTLEVRETNLPAQLFFKACGLLATHVLKGHYDDSTEDAYAMEWHINQKEFQGV